MWEHKIAEEKSEDLDAVSSGKESDNHLGQSIVVAAFIVAVAWVYVAGRNKVPPLLSVDRSGGNAISGRTEKSAKRAEIILPVFWGDVGVRMTSVGVIDAKKFRELYVEQGGLDGREEKLLSGSDNGNLAVTEKNAPIVLNLLWALGLGNKNAVLESGEMNNPRYGGAENFASVGGWTLAEGGATEHYSRHPFIILTPDQQRIVERVAKNIYRPCCNNAAYFPDCNHGMAMLGFLELAASQGVSEENMYQAALRLNSLWFPEQYETINGFLKSSGVSGNSISPKEILGKNYSSASGYRNILERFNSAGGENGGAGCDVGGTRAPQRSKPGCGV